MVKFNTFNTEDSVLDERIKTILLVDDSADFRLILKSKIHSLFKNKYKIIESDGPINALNLFQKHNKIIDIVICDFFLPIQNGNDLLEIVKSNKPQIQCYLVSGDINIRDRNYPYVDHGFYKLELDELTNVLK